MGGGTFRLALTSLLLKIIFKLYLRSSGCRFFSAAICNIIPTARNAIKTVTPIHKPHFTPENIPAAREPIDINPPKNLKPQYFNMDENRIIISSMFVIFHLLQWDGIVFLDFDSALLLFLIRFERFDKTHGDVYMLRQLVFC